MSRPNWDRVKQIFHEIRGEPRAERERLLGVLCGEDDELRTQVLALLVAEDEAGDFLDLESEAGLDPAALAGASVAASSPPEGPGSRIGPYKLLQEIGEGGFGVVYMAEQEEPIRRRVALKVIKPGMDTKQVIARFEAERQALAMMDHPNIAKVFDAGTTLTGRPYFVMELVKGIPITEYCDEHRLDTRARLDLFGNVCGAVHHAHQNGIIHRDLKPTNVMVTLHDGTPVPKVIDFGVAKATHQRLTERTLFTEYNQFIGTPAYMSPEQAAYEGLDVDARSDVYSLGVLLYELLTGTTPFDSKQLRRAAYVEVLRILKEEEPPKPSTRIHTLGKSGETNAKHRSIDADALEKLLRGDLDWIVMKALEKDRGRRYESPKAMAEDIGRYFRREAIVARPPSRVYRARKLLERRRGPLAAAAVAVLVLVAEIGYLSFQRNGTASGAADVPAPATEMLLSSQEEDEYVYLYLPTPSPDGTRIGYLDIGASPGVYVRDLETGETRRVSDEGYFWGLAWSPDGTRLVAGEGAVVGQRPVIFDVETGVHDTPSALADVLMTPTAWSPDGQHLAGVMPDADGDISAVVVSLETGESTVLAEGIRQGQASPSFSPDGRFVAFGDIGGDSEDLYVVELATGERWPLVAGPGLEPRALWSPDGRNVLYQNREGSWVLPVSNGRPVGQARLLGSERRPARAWTDEGLYYLVQNALNSGVRIGVDPETGRASGEWTPQRLTEGPFLNLRFAWSPDMRRSAAVGWSDGKLYVLEGNTTKEIPVGPEMLPASLWWAPDGSEVYLTSSDRAQRDRSARTVMAVDPNSGSVRDLFPHIEGLSHIHVSPDGSKMLSLQADGDQRFGKLVLSDLGERDGRVIATTNAHGGFSSLYGQPRFSPGGEEIAFLRHDEETTTLWVVRVDGTEERLLATRMAISGLQWDPSGRMIAFQEWTEDAQRLWIVSVEDGSAHEIESFAEMEYPQLRDWSSDGAWIAASDYEGWAELWVNREFSAEVEKAPRR